jgi:hypothetical protein
MRKWVTECDNVQSYRQQLQRNGPSVFFNGPLRLNRDGIRAECLSRSRYPGVKVEKCNCWGTMSRHCQFHDCQGDTTCPKFMSPVDRMSRKVKGA